MLEDRPQSRAGASSVISSNYRKDWAHHHNPKSSSSTASTSGMNGRASSVISLCSAPGCASSDPHRGPMRHSTSDLTALGYYGGGHEAGAGSKTGHSNRYVLLTVRIMNY